jgi:hypothetical protein
VLKNPLSVELGIGPVCRAKDIFDSSQEEFDFMKVQAIEGFDQDIVCSWGENGIVTNVPHRIKKHSPTGMAFGYAGSGPADFALNILSIFIGQEAAERGGLYQSFKFDFIAGLPEQGGTIPCAEIKAWIEKNMQGEET